MWINRSRVEEEFITRGCDIQILTFPAYTHFEFPKKLGDYFLSKHNSQSHTYNDRMKVGSCFYYWHVLSCLVIRKDACTFFADSISWPLHFHTIPSFLRSRVIALFLMKSLPRGKSSPETWLYFISHLSYFLAFLPSQWKM